MIGLSDGVYFGFTRKHLQSNTDTEGTEQRGVDPLYRGHEYFGSIDGIKCSLLSQNWPKLSL